MAAELSVKLGIYVSPRTVRAYWPPEPERRGRRRTSSQNWRAFVRNHAQSIVACDFLVVVTTRFRTLYVFLLVEVGTRRIVHCKVKWMVYRFICRIGQTSKLDGIIAQHSLRGSAETTIAPVPRERSTRSVARDKRLAPDFSQ